MQKNGDEETGLMKYIILFICLHYSSI